MANELRFPRLTPVIKMGERQRFNLNVVRQVIKKVNKKYHKRAADGVLSSLKDSMFSTPRIFVKTGVRPIDMIVSYGQGFPSGIIEIFGPEGSGKTAVLEKVLATAQRKGYHTAIFPTEYSLNYRRVKTVGLNDEMLIVGDASTIEDVYAQVRDIVTGVREEDPDTPIVLGWDSVHGDTEITTNKGKFKIRGLVGKKNLWLYTMNEKNKTLTLRKPKVIVRTGTQRKLIDVRFWWYTEGRRGVKHGAIKCTPKHEWWVIGKGWIRAKDLSVGDRLIPVVRHLRSTEGRWSVSCKHLLGKKWVTYQSRLMYEASRGVSLKSGEIVHHIDGNKQDDRPNNLLKIDSQGKHVSLREHRPWISGLRSQWQGPNNEALRKRLSRRIQTLFATSTEYRKAALKGMLARNIEQHTHLIERLKVASPEILACLNSGLSICKTARKVGIDRHRVSDWIRDNPKRFSSTNHVVEGIYSTDPSDAYDIVFDDPYCHSFVANDILIHNSVAATPTRAELKAKKGQKNSLEQADMGGAARQISKLFRRMVRFLFKMNVCLICINQTRTNLAQRYGDPETTYGGKALKFYAWVRCRISRIGIIKGKDDNEIGFMCKLKTIKNKFGAAPLKTCLVPIFWDRGIDSNRAVWEYATTIGVLKLKGRFYRFQKKVVTKRKFTQFYENNRKLIDKLMIRETLLKERGEGE